MPFITVDLRTVFGFYYYRIMPLATASVSKLEAFPPVLVVNRFALQFYPYTNASLYPRFHNITNFVISFRTTSICLILSYLLTKLVKLTIVFLNIIHISACHFAAHLANS